MKCIVAKIKDYCEFFFNHVLRKKIHGLIRYLQYLTLQKSCFYILFVSKRYSLEKT